MLFELYFTFLQSRDSWNGQSLLLYLTIPPMVLTLTRSTCFRTLAEAAGGTSGLGELCDNPQIELLFKTKSQFLLASFLGGSLIN